MARKRKQIGVDEADMNMTPMIDIVFQMIIFFVCTIDMDKKLMDERITLAMAPDSKAIEKKDPRTVIIDVHTSGRISMARAYMTPAYLESVMKKTVGQFGDVPVVIRADYGTEHRYVKKAMDACARAGIWKIKFEALKEKAENVNN